VEVMEGHGCDPECAISLIERPSRGVQFPRADGRCRSVQRIQQVQVWGSFRLSPGISRVHTMDRGTANQSWDRANAGALMEMSMMQVEGGHCFFDPDYVIRLS
jgi:hypothetical protein